jgi:hypothetical protein
MCCYNRCHSNAVEGFWALWDNIYDYVFTTLDFPVIFDGQFTGIWLNDERTYTNCTNHAAWDDMLM